MKNATAYQPTLPTAETFERIAVKWNNEERFNAFLKRNIRTALTQRNQFNAEKK